MKFPRLLLVAVLSFSPGCDQARQWAGKLAKKEALAPKPKITGPLVVEITDRGFDWFSRQPGKLSIVMFHAQWSGHSRQLEPFFQKLTASYGGTVMVGRLDIGLFPQFATQQQVKDVPDLRFFLDGAIVDRCVGLRNETEIREIVAKHAKRLVTQQDTSVKIGGKPIAEPMQKGWMPEGVRRR